MRAVVYPRAGEFTVQDIPVPTPGDDQVLVRMSAAGMCGTDLHLHEGQFLANFPLTPGHETIGTVEAIGGRLNGGGCLDGEGHELHLGQQVVVNPNSSCRTCNYCTEGRPWLCPDFAGIGSSTPGGFAEFVLVPGAQVFDATGIDPDLAVFAEPSACIAHLMDRLDPITGCSTVVLGAGPTGVLLTQFLLMHGAASVLLADPNEHKLAVASSLAPIETFLMNRDDVPGSMTRLVEAFAAQDVVIDATGRSAVIEALPLLARNGARIVYYGVADEHELVRISPFEVFRRELTIMGSFTEVDSFPDALNAFRSGRISMEGVITHRYPLDDYALALTALRTDRSAHKIVITPPRG